MFMNARGFAVAAAAVDAQGEVPMLLWPKVACTAFSLELYLKCLHRLRRRYIEGHNVAALFAKLSKADRTRVTTVFDEVKQGHPSYSHFVAAGVLMDIDSVLQRASDMFVTSRYWHELNLPSSDSSGLTSNAGVDRLCDSIRLVITEIKPDIVELAQNVRFPFAQVQLPPGGFATPK
jgi:hypothetical protein